MKITNKTLLAGIAALTTITAAGYLVKRRMKQREEILATDEK